MEQPKSFYKSDIFLTFLIFIIFTAVFIVIIYSILKKNIMMNIDRFRCDPFFMNYISYFGIDGVENFKYCVDGISTNITGEYNTDFTSIFSNVENLYNFITDSMTTLVTVLAAIKELIEKGLVGNDLEFNYDNI